MDEAVSSVWTYASTFLIASRRSRSLPMLYRWNIASVRCPLIRFATPATDLLVKPFCESLEIHIGRVHVSIELLSGRITHISCCHRDRFDASLAAGLRRIDGILVKDDRIVIREGNRAAAEFRRRACNGLRRCFLRQRLHLARLAHVPILAELAGEVAARRAEGEHRTSRKKMMQRFLFNRIDAEPARAAIGREHNAMVLPRSDETEALLPFVQLAITRAEIALDASVLKLMPIFRRRVHDGGEAARCSSLASGPRRHHYIRRFQRC